jgi:hypothetical protein
MSGSDDMVVIEWVNLLASRRPARMNVTKIQQGVTKTTTAKGKDSETIQVYFPVLVTADMRDARSYADLNTN